MRTGGEIKVVGDQYQRRFLLVVELLDQLHHVLARLPVEVPSRLIGEEDPRLIGEGACERHPLLLATGKLGRVVARAIPQAHPLEERHRGRSNGPSVRQRRAVSKLHRHHHVLERCQRGKQMESLEYEPDVVGTKARPTVFGESLEIFAGYGYRAFGRLVESGEKTQQGGLAAARRADDCHEALRFDMEIDSVQHTKGLTPTHVCL